jgi:transposase
MTSRITDLLVRQRTQAINALRGHLTEFGVIAAKGPVHTSKLMFAFPYREVGLGPSNSTSSPSRR